MPHLCALANGIGRVLVAVAPWLAGVDLEPLVPFLGVAVEMLEPLGAALLVEPVVREVLAQFDDGLRAIGVRGTISMFFSPRSASMSADVFSISEPGRRCAPSWGR